MNGFARQSGLYLPPRRTWGWVTFASFATLPIWVLGLRWPPVRTLASSNATVVGRARGQRGLRQALALLVDVGIRTGVAEEMFYRGFLLRRLSTRLGFAAANALHGLMFGLTHLGLFAVPGGPKPTLRSGLAVALLPGLAGWVWGTLNEYTGDGSLLPGWAAHTLPNLMVYGYLLTQPAPEIAVGESLAELL